MSKFKSVFCFLAVFLIFCGIVYSQPMPGDFDSRDPQKDFEAGYWAEFLHGGGEGQPGNIIRAGAEDYYEFRGAKLDNVVEIAKPKDLAGDPTKNFFEYRTVYRGGELKLFNNELAGWFNIEDDVMQPYLVKLDNTIVITKKYLDGEMEFALIVVDAKFVGLPGYKASVTAKFEKGKPQMIDWVSVNPPFPFPSPVDSPKPDGFWGPLSWAIISIEAPKILHVPLDIKPGSCPNPVNVKSNGVLPVAILGTDDFNVREIDPATIKLSGSFDHFEDGVEPLRWNYEDVAAPFRPFFDKADAYSCNQSRADGHADLSLKFDTQEFIKSLEPAVANRAQVRVFITGELYDGTRFAGQDVILILSNNVKPSTSKVLDIFRGATKK